MLHKTEGIVLKRHIIGNHDLAAYVYTKDYGRITAVGRNYLKFSHHGGKLDLFSYNEICFFERKIGDLDIFIFADSYEKFINIYQDIDRYQAISSAVEIVNEMTFLRDKNQDVFFILLNLLYQLDNLKDDNIYWNLISNNSSIFQYIKQ